MDGSEERKPAERPGRHVHSTLMAGAYGHSLKGSPAIPAQWNHSHPDGEFNLIMAGSGVYVIEDEGVYELKPQTLIWLMPGRVHKLLRGPNLNLWSVMFRPDLLKPDWLLDLAAQPSRVI